MSAIEESTVSNLKIAYYISNSLFLVAWCIAAAFTKGQISDIESELQENDENEGYNEVEGDE